MGAAKAGVARRELGARAFERGGRAFGALAVRSLERLFGFLKLVFSRSSSRSASFERAGERRRSPRARVRSPRARRDFLFPGFVRERERVQSRFQLAEQLSIATPLPASTFSATCSRTDSSGSGPRAQSAAVRTPRVRAELALDHVAEHCDRRRSSALADSNPAFAVLVGSASLVVRLRTTLHEFCAAMHWARADRAH
jgi:hypothetical protein